MEINNVTHAYWTRDDLEKVQEAKDFKDLYIIAEKILKRMPQPIVQVCGPIGTGGLGNVEANLAAFDSTIRSLQANGLHVFDQMPFEWPMQAIKFNLPTGVYPESILTDFYMPIFESGFVREFYFMPNWQTSKGATWEHEEARRLGIKINYL